MNPLILQFKEYGNFSAEAEADLHKKCVVQHRKKGDFYLKIGQTSSGLFVIEKGLVRAFFIKDDKEINSWFGQEEMILGSINPLFLQKPSVESIQFLEDSIIHSISRDNLNELCRKYPEINTIQRLMTEEYCGILEQRIFSLQTLSATERYNELIRDFPKLLQRISLGHIASYLGISQETLSRIRAVNMN